MAASHRITVADALAVPAVRRALPVVVAGADRLDRPVRWVHSGEVPNIASLLAGGELLLTTGMGISGRAAGQREFVQDLADRGVAALVVELGERFPDGLPSALVGAADRARLPLVELHAEVRFVAVTEAIHTAIVNKRYELVRRAETLYQRFTAVMLQGGGVPEVLSELAEAVGNPVLLESPDGGIVLHAVPSGLPADVESIAAWVRAAAERRLVGITAPLFGGGAWRLVALPVAAAFEDFAPLAVERAAGMIALALLRERQEAELLALGRGDLLARLAAGTVSSAVAAARAEEWGFSTGVSALLLPLVVSPTGGRGMLRDLDRELAAVGRPFLLGLDAQHHRLLVLAGLRSVEDRESVAGRTAEVVHAVAARAGERVTVAVGPVGCWESTAAGLRDAADAVVAVAGGPARAWHDAAAMPMELLLWRLRDHGAVERYVEELLGPLFAHDAGSRHRLLPTLEALCEHGGRKTDAARALYLNRQGLYARLARLERVLGRDLSDAATLLALHLAIRARRALERPC